MHNVWLFYNAKNQLQDIKIKKFKNFFLKKEITNLWVIILLGGIK